MNMLIIALVIIAIPFIIALFTTNEYKIEREVTINKPKEAVFAYVKLLKNQDHYSKWVMLDPNSKKNYTGTDGTVGFIYAWNSENKQAGKGEQEIIKITEGEKIDIEVRFIKPFEGTAYTHMTTAYVSENETKVKWVFTGLRNYPVRIMHLLLNLKKMLGKDMETSLATLKSVIEKS